MSETKKQVKMDIYPGKKIAVIRKTDLSSNNSLVTVVSKAPQIGEVMFVGSGKKPVDFDIGSIVTYREFGEYEFFINGETVYFVKFADILGVLKEKNK